MTEWWGVMNWPIEREWKCEFCGSSHGVRSWLVWGFVHGECRCSGCEVRYTMLDENRKPVTTPIHLLKPEFVEPFKRIWKETGTSVGDVTRAMWVQYGVPL